MNRQLRGLLFIIFGSFLIFIFAAEFLFRAFFVVLGIYLIYKGLQLRNAQNVLFYFYQIKNKFNRF